MKIASMIEPQKDTTFHFPFSTHIMQVILDTKNIKEHLLVANDQFNINNANDN